MTAGQNVRKASIPKPMGFGSGSRENNITANSGTLPIMSRTYPAQNSLLTLKVCRSTSLHLRSIERPLSRGDSNLGSTEEAGSSAETSGGGLQSASHI